MTPLKKQTVVLVLWMTLASPFIACADTLPSAPTSPNESQLVEHGHYINKDGNVVHSPAHTKSEEAPAGATAKCRDGSFSFSQHHQGT